MLNRPRENPGVELHTMSCKLQYFSTEAQFSLVSKPSFTAFFAAFFSWLQKKKSCEGRPGYEARQLDIVNNDLHILKP